MIVIWVIGVSGSGKSFFSKKLFKKLKRDYKKTIWIDGDRFRKKYSKDLSYSLKDRKKNSKRIQKFCLKYYKKNYIVICSVLSIFPLHQKLNRKIFKNYFQIQIDGDFFKIKLRNNKKIYTKKKNVVGKDLKFPKPYKTNLKIKNNFDKKFQKEVTKAYSLIKQKLL